MSSMTSDDSPISGRSDALGLFSASDATLLLSSDTLRMMTASSGKRISGPSRSVCCLMALGRIGIRPIAGGKRVVAFGDTKRIKERKRIGT